jgi:hypothetical protein
LGKALEKGAPDSELCALSIAVPGAMRSLAHQLADRFDRFANTRLGRGGHFQCSKFYSD